MCVPLHCGNRGSFYWTPIVLTQLIRPNMFICLAIAAKFRRLLVQQCENDRLLWSTHFVWFILCSFLLFVFADENCRRTLQMIYREVMVYLLHHFLLLCFISYCGHNSTITQCVIFHELYASHAVWKQKCKCHSLCASCWTKLLHVNSQLHWPAQLYMAFFLSPTLFLYRALARLLLSIIALQLTIHRIRTCNLFVRQPPSFMSFKQHLHYFLYSLYFIFLFGSLLLMLSLSSSSFVR